MRQHAAAVFVLSALLLVPPSSSAQSITLDTTGLRPGPIAVASSDNSVTVTWADEAAQTWRATFSLDPSRPLISSIAAASGPVVSQARPFYRGETGKRRGGWDAFFDDPTSHPDGTQHVQSTFTLRGATARNIGDRVELLFDGMRMGSFQGALAYTSIREAASFIRKPFSRPMIQTSRTTTMPGSTWRHRPIRNPATTCEPKWRTTTRKAHCAESTATVYRRSAKR
jgi:hypothetical protein